MNSSGEHGGRWGGIVRDGAQSLAHADGSLEIPERQVTRTSRLPGGDTRPIFSAPESGLRRFTDVPAAASTACSLPE